MARSVALQARVGSERVHPLYELLAPYWDFLRCSYLGGEAWFAQGITGTINNIPIGESSDAAVGYEMGSRSERAHLWRHPKEEQAEYDARLRSASYPNLVEPAVKTQSRALTRGVTGPELPAQMGYLADDMDGRGTDIVAWRGAACDWALVHGAWVFCDRRSVDLPEGANREQEMDAGGRAYAQILSPLDLLDWSWNEETGRCRWAKMAVRRALESDPDGKRGEQKLVTRTYLEDGSWEERAGRKVLNAGTHPLGRVPLVPFFADRDPLEPEPVALSAIKDIAYFARQIFNKKSWLTEQEWGQCYNTLVLNSRDKITSKKRIALGVSRYLAVEGGASMLAPDVAPMTHMLASMRADADLIRAMFGIEAGGDGAGVESASALVLRREGVDAILSGMAARLEVCEKNVWLMLAELEGQASWKPELAYARDYTHLAKMTRVEGILAALKAGGFDGPAGAELRKEVIDALLPDLPKAKRTEIADDLEKKAAEPPPILPGMEPELDENGEPIPPEEEAPPVPGSNGAAMKPGTPLVAQKKPAMFGGG